VRKLALLLLAAVVVVSGGPVEAGPSGDGGVLFRTLNHERIERARGRLQWDPRLVACATERARELAENWAHSTDSSATLCLADTVRWDVIGEAIGRAYSIEQVWDLLMASDAHRSLLLKARWNRVAIGVYHNDTMVFVTVWVRRK
jgi:Uncharacterized protein with SCP/PR1 domains